MCQKYLLTILYALQYEETLLSVGVLCWLIKGLVWQTILIYQCEEFYSAVESVQDTCALILKSNCSGYIFIIFKTSIQNPVKKTQDLIFFTDKEKKICRNVLRLHQASFSKIRVFGLFYVDAALELNLMSLLTRYTVVLLQFAIL